MAPDHFGAGGDIGNVFIAASNQRERETSHIGVPGHPAPAYERWLRTHHERAAEVTRREVEAIEQAMLDEGAAAMAGADEEKMDDAAAMEDEEKIVKMLAYKYVEIQAKQAAREKGESDRSKLQKLEEEQVRVVLVVGVGTPPTLHLAMPAPHQPTHHQPTTLSHYSAQETHRARCQKLGSGTSTPSGPSRRASHWPTSSPRKTS